MLNFTFAGVGNRLVAQIIDSLIVGFAMSIIIIPIFGAGIFASMVGNEDSAGAFAFFAMIPVIAIASIGPIIYEVVMLSSSRQATFGKVLMKIKVVDEQGQKLTVGAAIGRTLIKYISFNLCFLLWLWPLFNDKEQGLHDIIVKDLVVRDQMSLPV